MSTSNIEWTDATWNPIVGCSIVSPGCTNCYAMKMAARIQKMNRTGGSNSNYVNHYDGTTKAVNGNVVWTGKLAQAPDKIFLQPLSRKAPTTYFVNSMGDLFHEDCPDEWIDRVFAVMALSPQHTFQVLTKRVARMRDYMTLVRLKMGEEGLGSYECIYNAMGDLGREGLTEQHPYRAAFPNGMPWPLPNVWLGVSTERQQEADERIRLLLDTPAAIRFISAEPLLGPIDLTRLCILPQKPGSVRAGIHLNALRGRYCESGVAYKGDWDVSGPAPPDSERRQLDWVIVGGESGPHARPMHPGWAQELRDQCAAAGVMFFFKQWGEYLPVGQSLPGCGKVHGATAVKPGRMKLHYAGAPKQAPKYAFGERGVGFASTDNSLTFRVGKKAAGRLLDGEPHNAMPERRA